MRLLLAGLLLASLMLPPSRAAGAGAVLVLSPQPLQVAPGERVTLTAGVRDVTNLYAVELHLRFDPALLQVVSDSPAAVAPASEVLSPDFVALNRFDNAAGFVDVAFTQISPSEPASGSGALLTVTFVAVAAGSAAVTANSFILSDLDGFAMPAQSTQAQISIGSGVADQPTAASNVTIPSPPSPEAPSALPTDAALQTTTAPIVSDPARVEPVATESQVSPAAVIAPTEASVAEPALVVATPTPADSQPVARAASSAPEASLLAPAETVPDPLAEVAAATLAPGAGLDATATPQRLAAVPAQPPALAEPPARVAAAGAQAGSPPTWLLFAGLALVSLALALAALLLLVKGGERTSCRHP